MKEICVLCMSHYACLTQVESSRVGRCHCTCQRDVSISRVAVRGKPRRRNWKPLFLSPSLFSFLFPFRFTHIHPWLLLTYFSPSPSRRGTSRYIHGVLHASEEHCAWSRTVSHALTRTNAHVIDQGASRASRSEKRGRKRPRLFSLRN